MTRDDLRALIRTVPDFPARGIRFRDISTLICDPAGLAGAIDQLESASAGSAFRAVAGIEARGFVFGAALAVRLGLGFVPLRKAGKLPVPTLGEDYTLEYGEARLELDPTMIAAGDPVLLVDDLLATGGTALAGARLLRRAGAVCSHALFVIDLPELGGAELLRANAVEPTSLIHFAGH